jgi:hypothetical protein
VLLDVKRNGEFKARIVVRGDKENKEAVDGKDFRDYAVTADLTFGSNDAASTGQA